MAQMQASLWTNHFEDHIKAYRTKEILILWGDDFAHIHADATYANLDDIIEAINLFQY